MITLIAIAQIADLLNESRDKYSPKAENEFYERVGNSRVVRFAAFLASLRLSGKTLRSQRAKRLADPSAAIRPRVLPVHNQGLRSRTAEPAPSMHRPHSQADGSPRSFPRP